MNSFRFFLFLLLTSASFIINAQKGKEFYLVDSINLETLSLDDRHLLDSLLPVYHTSTSDTIKINAIARIIESCNDDDVWPRYNNLMADQTAAFLEKSNLSPVEKLFFKSKLADAINNFGFLKIYRGEVDGALKDFQKSFSIQKEAGNKRGMAHSLGNIGYVYKNQGNIFKAIDSYHQALKLSEEVNDDKGIANLYNNLGLLYKSQGEIDKALEYYQKSLKISEKLNNTSNMAACLNNLGFIYSSKGDPDKALTFYIQSLKYDRENGDAIGFANSLNSIGVIYERKGLLDTAFSYYTRSLEIFEKNESKKGIGEVLINISKIHFDKGQIDQSYTLGAKALLIAKELGYPVLISDAASLMYDIYKHNKDWQNAIEMQELFLAMKDSILNNETQKAAMRQQLKYEFEKQDAQAKMERQQQAIVTLEEKKRQRIVIASVSAGLVLMMAFAGFIYNRYRISKHQKLIIEKQKQQVDIAYDQLSEKNKEIIDSIHYAKRIQSALLKEQDHVSSHLPEHFILFKPKDIVSGDFYWSYEKEGYWYVAAADCTGHGVPGAFLTMLGTAFLNEIVNTKELLSPSDILNQLRDKIVMELSQSGNDSDLNFSLLKDGMDMSLLKFHLESGEAEWAGANNGMIILRNTSADEYVSKGYKVEKLNGEVFNIYISPDKQPIGFSHHQTPFTNHKMNIQKGDTVYLFTDGYADQFGGPQGKKLKFKALQRMLADQQRATLKEQKEMLSKKFDEWKGDLEQVDDVTLIGVRV